MNIHYQNTNELTKYPFNEWCSLIGKVGLLIGKVGLNDFELPKDFIVDSLFNTSEDNLYMKYIHFRIDTITIDIYNVNNNYITSAIAILNTSSDIQLYEFNSIPGFIKFGKGIYTLPKLHIDVEFTYQDSSIVHKCILKNISQEITSIKEFNNSNLLTGNINLLEGYNINMEYSSEDNSITVNADLGTGLGEFLGEPCDEPNYCSGALKTINGIGPNNSGQFFIRPVNHATVKDYLEEYKIVLGTQIDPSRINCIRSGTKGKKGPSGPQGPKGFPGENAPEGVCIVCDN